MSITGGEAVPLIGFQVGKVIVTGESTGGNLAAALCIKLCKDGLVDVSELRNQRKQLVVPDNSQFMVQKVRLPDALLLSCPALNLSLDEFSPSRFISRDAVLPSALISTISNTYLGENPKTDPLASPLYATDTILSIFPPTLIYASSEDPFLDDSVVFNKRLKRLGVACNLKAVTNLPHAYFGLGTAGFPEVKTIQRECEDWMKKILNIPAENYYQ